MDLMMTDENMNMLPESAGGLVPGGFGGPNAPPPMASGELMVQTFGAAMTSQRVAVPRNEMQIAQKIRQYAARYGDRYVYSWEAKDRRNNRKVTIEGPTIKLANDLARIYGNCATEVSIKETPTHYHIYARFTDLETGYSLVRPFVQRKSQSMGMQDADRQADLVLQIGVSKAIRNVVVNALANFAEQMVEDAKRGLVEWVGRNAEKADQFIDGMMEKHSIDLLRIEAVFGRKRKEWTARNIAGVIQQLRAIDDGMVVRDEVFPSLEDAAEVAREKDENAADVKRRGRPPKSAKPAEPAAAEQQRDAAPVATPTAPPPTESVAAPADDRWPEIPEQLRRNKAAPAAQQDDDDLFPATE